MVTHLVRRRSMHLVGNPHVIDTDTDRNAEENEPECAKTCSDTYAHG